MFTGVENCARTPPMLFPVEPLPWELSRSMTRTLPQPAVVRCQAILEPTIPPPTMTTSALCMLHHVYDNYSVEVTPKMRRLRNVGIPPSIFSATVSESNAKLGHLRGVFLDLKSQASSS